MPPPLDWAALGRRVYEARTAQGLTQEQLAAKAHVTGGTVSRLESATRDNYNVAKARAIWTALGLPIDEMTRILHGPRRTPSATIEALRDDPKLTDGDRATLISLYERFTQPGGQIG